MRRMSKWLWKSQLYPKTKDRLGDVAVFCVWFTMVLEGHSHRFEANFIL